MGVGSAILGFLSALPQLVKLAWNVWEFIKKIAGDDPAGFIKQSAETFDFLSKAETPEQKREAARRIQDLIRGL